MTGWEFLIVVVAIASVMAHSYNRKHRKQAPRLAGRTRVESQPRGRKAPVSIEAADDSLLDRLEVRHGTAAQRALAAANAGEKANALRYYTEAHSLAATLYAQTRDALWAEAMKGYAALIADYTRMLNARPAPVSRPATVASTATASHTARPQPATSKAIPMPAASNPPAPAKPDKREELIGKLMAQLKCDRALAETMADRHLASQAGAA